MRQLKLVGRPQALPKLPNLKRAANLLEDLPTLWLHSGVTHEQRESLVREVFRRMTIDGKEFVSIEPQAAHVPLFATMVVGQEFGYRVLKSPPSLLTRQRQLRAGIRFGALVFHDRPGPQLDVHKLKPPNEAGLGSLT